MNPLFKPKKQQIHVPGYGVVQKEEFEPKHTKALLKRAEENGVNRDAFIKQHLVVDGYGDQPLFSDEVDSKNLDEAIQKAGKEDAAEKKRAEAQAKKDAEAKAKEEAKAKKLAEADEEELQKLMEQEEKEKKEKENKSNK